MRSVRDIALVGALPAVALSFYPFNAEDTGTLGALGRFQTELNLSYSRQFNGDRQKDATLQLTAGLSKNMDVAALLPYSQRGQAEGLNDLGLFVKHVPLEVRGHRIGYKLQLNLDTGKEGIGYGKTTAQLNLMAERPLKGFTLNTNLFYSKTSQVEGLRDSYGFYLHAYGDVGKWLTLGAEFKYVLPQDKTTDKVDTHLLFGIVFHPRENLDLSLGFQKGLSRQEGFTDYSFLAGFLLRF
ncbi:MAG: hypothetical protein N3C13_01575 [Aquificaceae bacterium]|nr:hypothetical protein [Aquificaceae bacterium]